MAIIATSNGNSQRELIEPGNYVARCYKMLQIGTVKETIMGVEKTLHKVRIGWELPGELRVFSEEKGEQPIIIDKEYTLSMHEKSRLRADLKSWRGKDFSEDEAKAFDITKLIGAPCMLNIIHKPSKDGLRQYEEISSIAKMPKGMDCPAAISKIQILSYDDFDWELFESQPDFIKDKIKASEEYKNLQSPGHKEAVPAHELVTVDDDDLPF